MCVCMNASVCVCVWGGGGGCISVCCLLLGSLNLRTPNRDVTVLMWVDHVSCAAFPQSDNHNVVVCVQVFVYACL